VVGRLLAEAPGGQATARQAVAWAEEGGPVASADAVLAALDGYRVVAEERPEPIDQPAVGDEDSMSRS
jgi:hypothetical protein